MPSVVLPPESGQPVVGFDSRGELLASRFQDLKGSFGQ